MGKWTIDKTFDFCYGHRVWTQKLNSNYADDLKCACRHLHGHEGNVQVFLTGDTLDNTGMITDFRHLEWLKKLINSTIDHRFIVDKNDPLYDKIVGNNIALKDVVVGSGLVIGHVVDLDLLDFTPDMPEYEYFEGLLIVDFVPTSENLSKWLADFADYVMAPLNVAVSQVDWWETPRSRSTYVRDVAIFKDGIRQ